jgi:hypothetical protein
MKLTNFQIMNPQFVPALENLLKKEMPLSTCEELAECLLEIEEKSKIIQKVRLSLIDKYLVKDDKGKPVVIDNKIPQFVDEEAKSKFMAEVSELLKGNFEVKFDSKVVLKETEVMPAHEYMLIKDFIKIEKNVSKPIDTEKK